MDTKRHKTGTLFVTNKVAVWLEERRRVEGYKTLGQLFARALLARSEHIMPTDVRAELIDYVQRLPDMPRKDARNITVEQAANIAKEAARQAVAEALAAREGD